MLYINSCFAAGVMIIPDSLPVEVNLDVCDTMPMFVEDIELPSAPKDAVVFTTGSESSDPPTATTDVTGDHVDGSKETDSVDPPRPPVKKPRALPPVPMFQPSKPDESDVP